MARLKALAVNLVIPFEYLGLVTNYNGVQVNQTRDYIEIHCCDCIERLLKTHGWSSESPTNSPTMGLNSAMHMAVHTRPLFGVPSPNCHVSLKNWNLTPKSGPWLPRTQFQPAPCSHSVMNALKWATLTMQSHGLSDKRESKDF